MKKFFDKENTSFPQTALVSSSKLITRKRLTKLQELVSLSILHKYV